MRYSIVQLTKFLFLNRGAFVSALNTPSAVDCSVEATFLPAPSLLRLGLLVPASLTYRRLIPPAMNMDGGRCERIKVRAKGQRSV